MPRQSLNVVGKIGGRKCKVRKRRYSSSSSSSLVQSYRLKRAFLVGKRVGSSTPVPRWKMMSSKSPCVENDKVFRHLAAAKASEKAKELPFSARKLAATLWEIDGLPSPVVKRENIEDIKSELGSTARLSSDVIRSPLSERMDPPKMAGHIRRASAGSHKLVMAECYMKATKSPHDYLVEVDQTQNLTRSPCRDINGTKSRLKDVCNGLVTSKELLKVMSRVCHFEEQNCTGLSLFSALKFELGRACINVSKLIQEQRTKGSEIDILLKRMEEEKLLWKMKERDRIRSAVMSIAGELETERKLRRQTERLNKKLGRDLAETKASLSKAAKELEREKRAREILEQVCDELARGIGEDRAEVEVLKKRSAKVCEEVEREREMLQLPDVIRGERVQMKLSETEYQFEEKNVLVDKLKSELEACINLKEGEERGDDSPRFDKIKELKKYLRETLPSPYEYRDKEIDDIVAVNKDDEEEDDDDDSADSDLHSIVLNMDDISKSFQWSDAFRHEPKRNSVDKSKGRRSDSDKIKKPMIGYEFATGKQEELDMFDRRGLFEFPQQPRKKDAEDEIERYNMIKDLRDHIVSNSRIVTSQESTSPSQKFGQPSVSPNDPPNGVACHG